MHILPGSQYIHSLFHLDRPSATITVRTEHTPSAAVQYDYRKPYFALNPFFRNVTMAKKLQRQFVVGNETQRYGRDACRFDRVV